MTNFMSSDNNTTETASIFNNCNTVDLLKTLVNHTCSGDVCKSECVYGFILIKLQKNNFKNATSLL